MAKSGVVDRESVAIVLHDEMESIRRSVAALGDALQALNIDLSPSMVKAVAQQVRRREALAAEFGLLTSAEAGERMGSRAVAKRNAAAAARSEGRLVALKHGRYFLYPGFQFDEQGIRPVIAELKAVADEYGWDEASLIAWIMSPTTYLGGKRPVDVLDDRDLVVKTARDDMGVVW